VIEKHNQLDLELYHYAKQRFDIAIRELGRGTVKIFAISNWLYQNDKLGYLAFSPILKKCVGYRR
jgi:hypothetical protein